MSVEYTSEEPSGVRIDDRQIVKGDVIAGPPDVVAELAKRPGFRLVGAGVAEVADDPEIEIATPQEE